MTDLNLIREAIEQREKATPGEWQSIVTPRFCFVRTVEKIVKNDPGNFPSEYSQDILEDGEYETKAGDSASIAANHNALPAFRRALAKYVHCERPNTCCEVGHHSKKEYDDPGQTHYMVPCGECDGCLLLKIVEEK